MYDRQLARRREFLCPLRNSIRIELFGPCALNLGTEFKQRL
jgi:hypothetical protein